METRANRDGNSTVGHSPSSLSLSLPFYSAFSDIAFRSVLLPLCQCANVFAFRSLRRFQIISRPIVLFLTTRRPLSLSSDRLRYGKSSSHRPRAPSLPSRPVSLV